MTEGPMHWMAINGTYHGDYWLLKTDHFDVVLEPLSKAFTGTVVATVAGNSKLEMRPELAVDELIEKSKPAVVLLNPLPCPSGRFNRTTAGLDFSMSSSTANSGRISSLEFPATVATTVPVNALDRGSSTTSKWSVFSSQ